MNYQASLKPGDIVKLRGGLEGEVRSVDLDNKAYPICVRMASHQEHTFTADGKFQSGRLSDLDIVDIVHRGYGRPSYVSIDCPELDARDYFVKRMGGII